MNAAIIAGTVGALFAVGLYGLLARSELVHRILGANIMANAVFLALIAAAARHARIDPVPHAMVLTGIVIAMSMTAVALILLRRFRHLGGSALEDCEGDADD